MNVLRPGTPESLNPSTLHNVFWCINMLFVGGIVCGVYVPTMFYITGEYMFFVGGIVCGVYVPTMFYITGE